MTGLYDRHRTECENENEFINQTKRFQEKLKLWEDEKEEFYKTQNELKANFSSLIRTDINTMSEYLEKFFKV